MSEKRHAVSIFANAPFDSVWTWVSDPCRFPTIYPSWLRRAKKIRRGDGEVYEGVLSWNGGRMEIVPRLDRERGQADFEIVNEDGNVELFRAHIGRVSKKGITFLMYWWEGVDDPFEAGLKLGVTKADLHRVKETIERDAALETTAWYPYPPYNEAFVWLDDSRVGRQDREVHIPTFARNMLERLREVGLVRTADESPANMRKVTHVKDDKQQDIWIRFNTRRTLAGYMDVEVMEAPRSEAAILAAMVAWGAKPMDFERVLEELADKRAREELIKSDESFRALEKRTQAYLQDLKSMMKKDGDVAAAEWDSVIDSYLEDTGGVGVFDIVPPQLSYILHIICYYRPEFDSYSLRGKLDFLRRTYNYVTDILQPLQELQSFLEYGTPNRNLYPVVENPKRDVKVAILHDVEGLSYREIGDRIGHPIDANSKSFKIKRDPVTLRKIGDRGKSILEEAFGGKEGWTKQIEAMKAQKAWWRSLNKAEQDKEEYIEIYASERGITIEEARRRYERRRF